MTLHSFVAQQFKSLIKHSSLNSQKSIAQTNDKANDFNLHSKRHFSDGEVGINGSVV